MSSSTSSSKPLADSPATRRPLLRCLLFAGALLLTLPLVGAALEAGALRLDANIDKVRAMQSLAQRSDDILFIGDSTTFEGVDAQLVADALELETYNLATGGQSVLESRLVLEDYLRRNAAPRLLVLGVYINRPRDGAPMNPDLFLSLPADLQDAYVDRYRALDGSTLKPSYRVFNSLRAYRYRTTIDRSFKVAIAGGSRIPQLVRGQARFAASRPAHLGPEHDIHFENEALVELLDYCDSIELPVAMVELPNHAGYSERSRGRVGALELLHAQAGRREHVTFRSFNDDESLEYADDEWIGLNHLNARGAARFTEEQLLPHLVERLGAGAETAPAAR